MFKFFSMELVICSFRTDGFERINCLPVVGGKTTCRSALPIIIALVNGLPLTICKDYEKASSYGLKVVFR